MPERIDRAGLGNVVTAIPQTEVDPRGGTGQGGMGVRIDSAGDDRRLLGDGNRPGDVDVMGAIVIRNGSSVRNRLLRRGTNPATISSIPSTATAGEMAASDVDGSRPNRAASTSTRWIVVSWTCRRAQNCRAGGAP